MDTNKVNFEYTGINRIKGSLTVEASVIYPLFILVIVALMFLLKAVNNHLIIQNDLISDANKASVRATLSDKLSMATMVGSGISIHSKVGGVLLPHKSNGYDHEYSYLSGVDVLPNPLFNEKIRLYNNVRSKIWNGDKDNSDEKEYVFVTKNGKVYHNSLNCIYLKRSTRGVDINDIDSYRNESGGRYYPCKICGKTKTNSGIVYITSYGSSYHRLSNCWELVRDIKRIPISEVDGRGRCSKCYQ